MDQFAKCLLLPQPGATVVTIEANEIASRLFNGFGLVPFANAIVANIR